MFTKNISIGVRPSRLFLSTHQHFYLSKVFMILRPEITAKTGEWKHITWQLCFQTCGFADLVSSSCEQDFRYKWCWRVNMTKSSVVKAAVSHGYRVLKEVCDGGEAKQKKTKVVFANSLWGRAGCRLRVAGFMCLPTEPKAATSVASSVAPCLTSDLFQRQVPLRLNLCFVISDESSYLALST